MADEQSNSSATGHTVRVIGAFAIIYLVWGSTYLAIRYAVETLPPFLMGGARFLCAGLILFPFLVQRGARLPEWSHWTNAAVVGALLLGIGNGAVNWAEKRIPSGTTALLIAITPVWFALLDWLRPGGGRPRFQSLIGIAVGFLGVIVLVWARDPRAGQILDLPGVAAVLAAGLAWAGGSLYARYTPKPETPLMAVSLQMITGGILMLLVGVVRGEVTQFSFHQLSSRSVWAFVYLTIFGSLVAFTAYSWLLRNTTPTRLSTYAYINPVIAVVLGWAFAGEVVSSQMLLGAGVILAGVMILLFKRS